MTTLRPFTCDDLLQFNSVNLDPFTETYGTAFYAQYLAQWPSLQLMARGPGGRALGYLLAKSEGDAELWHGHVSAVTVAPSARRLGVASGLCGFLEAVSDGQECRFVDLFVRKSNVAAVAMYERLGYTVYREVIDYYQGGGTVAAENAYDMRKALSADPEKKSMQAIGKVYPEDLEWM